MRRLLLAAAFLLCATLCAYADDKGPPEDASPDAVARRREELRTALLVAYRRQRGFHVTFSAVMKRTGEAAEETAPRFMTIFVEDDRAAFQTWCEAETDGFNRAWLISPERCVTVEDEEEPTVARGMDFQEARSRKLNTELARLAREHEVRVARIPPMRFTVEILVRRDSDADVGGTFGAGMRLGDGNPSWLRKTLWDEQRVEDANEEFVVLGATDEKRWIDRSTGLLLRLDAKSRDGSATCRVQRKPNIRSPDEWRAWMKATGQRTAGESRGSVGAGIRARQVRLLLRHLHDVQALAPGRAQPWLSTVVPRLVRALYDDALAAEELAQLVRFGQQQLEGATAAGKAPDGQSWVLRDMQRWLVERWWLDFEERLPAATPTDGAKTALPPRNSALAAAFRDAIRAYANRRVASAWAD